ncbi:hypothetical protein ACP70R_042382 [Stipagrostis hirtigluma subsp. patula]
MVKAQSKQRLEFGGAIFLCNQLTRKECFEKKLFGLGAYFADFVERVKAGTTLFLYDIDQRKLHGVFEATSDGAMDIIPDAYISVGQHYPSQIRFKRIWFCKPLMEGEFQGAIQKSFAIKNKFSYGLSHQQVSELLQLFSLRIRLQSPHNLRVQDVLSNEHEMSFMVKEIDMPSSPNSSSCGSLRSPCQTCSSSTLGEHAASLVQKLIDPVSLVQRELQSNISDVTKSSNSKSPLHTVADTAICTIPSNQEAMDDQSTDDYIPLPQEDDALEGIDDLFGFLEDENHSFESKGSSDSEDLTTFHQACVRKEDGSSSPMVNSKLRSDIGERKSVFSRLLRTQEKFVQRKRSKTKAFPPRSAEFSNPLSQRRKQWRAQRNKPNDGMLDMPSVHRLSGVPAQDYSYVWSGSRRATKFSRGKQTNTQTCLGPTLCEDGSKWVISTKEPVRHDTCRKLFVPKGSRKWIRSCDKELNVPPVPAGVHESSEVSVKKETRIPSLNFQHANHSNVERDQDFDNEDVEEAGRKKRLVSAFLHQEYPIDTALASEGNKAMDMLATSDGNCKETSISLSSKDTYTQLARPYLETKVTLPAEQQQSTQHCSEYGETSLIPESSKTLDSFPIQSYGDRTTLSNDETCSYVAAVHLGTETSLQETKPSVRSCHGVIDGDKILPLGKFENMDSFPKPDEDCGIKKSLPSDGDDRLNDACHLETEMPLLQKQTPNVHSSEVVHDDEVSVPEIPEVMFPNFDAVCGNKGTSSGSDCMVELCHLDPNCRDAVPSDAAAVESSGPLSNFHTFHGDSANQNSLLHETLDCVSTGHKEATMFCQDETYNSCCGDTSSVLPYSAMDTSAGDGGSEHKNSFDQKDGEVLYSLTGSKDLECSKVKLLKEEQYQNFQCRPELAHESSNSVESFAVSAEGCGSKSGISADRTSDHQDADLLGTNSESRTSFFNDSSSGSAETLSTSALGGENVDHSVNGSEVYAETPILQHDPGEMKPL